MVAVYAHSLPGEPEERWEKLRDHSAAVGTLAAEFAAHLGWVEALRLAGQLHDIGKISPDFQDYIAARRTSGGDHSSAGARIALDHCGPHLGKILAAIIAAHHSGLADGEDLTRRMEAAARLVPTGWQDHAGPFPDLATLRPTVPLPTGGSKGFASSFLIRMLFSCLVDADFIATERFYADAAGDRAERGGHTDLVELRDRLRAHMAAMVAERADARSTPLNALRADILDHAVAKAPLPPGLFSLTVPTGGGKTLASLSFALDHAVRHDLRRVIYVIPYAGAWIETRSWASRGLKTWSPPCGGVDRNNGTVIGNGGVGGSPPCGGVDRNKQEVDRRSIIKEVAPMRGRGSKHVCCPLAAGRCRGRLHAGAWIETSPCAPGAGMEGGSPPCGGVDRNQFVTFPVAHAHKVAPMRGRGSKPLVSKALTGVLRRPHAGAWIETSPGRRIGSAPQGRPHAGAWIETFVLPCFGRRCRQLQASLI